jgi:CDP-glucose 4,6-dehydratase
MAVTSRDWLGKRVLLTGHTGFKGAWMALWLHRLGAKVVGIGLPPSTHPNLFELARIDAITASHFCDIRDAKSVAALTRSIEPEVIFHFAAQSLVRAGYHDPLATFATNTQGTANVLDALRPLESPRVVVAVTTDKVYRNLEQAYPYRETDALGGHDPYSASKAAAELVIAGYRDSYLAAKGIAVASARAGNVIGGGDWAADRLIPEAVCAWNSNRPVRIRNPQAVRPWQHVLDALAAYLRLAERLWNEPDLAAPYNFGPATDEAASVRKVVTLAQSAYGRGEIEWGEGVEGPHETSWLSLEIAKARSTLGVQPRWALAQAVEHTMDWYRRQNEGLDARSACEADIDAYESQAPSGESS